MAPGPDMRAKENRSKCPASGKVSCDNYKRPLHILLSTLHPDTYTWISIVLALETPRFMEALTLVKPDRPVISIQHDRPHAFAHFTQADLQQGAAEAFPVMDRVHVQPGEIILV